MEAKKRGRPSKNAEQTRCYMLRMTFQDEADRERILDFLAEVCKGRSIGRTVRDIIDAARMMRDRI